MKHILKFPKNEPNALKLYRKTTENAKYAGYVDKDIENPANEKPLKNALGEEQGWICAYCNQDISVETLTVEHYITQNKHEESPYSVEFHAENDLNFMNMLGTCRKVARDCSGLRGNSPLKFIDPTNSDIEKKIAYRKKIDGKDIGYEMIAVEGKDSDKIQYELDKVLKLNDFQLCRARNIVIDKLKSKFHKKGKWERTEIEAEIQRLQSRIIKDTKGKKGFQQYCMVAIWYLKEKLKKPYYALK